MLRVNWVRGRLLSGLEAGRGSVFGRLEAGLAVLGGLGLEVSGGLLSGEEVCLGFVQRQRGIGLVRWPLSREANLGLLGSVVAGLK